MLTALGEMDESLLSAPSSNGANEGTASRATMGYKASVFQAPSSKELYTQQYAGIYFSRLNLLRPRVLEAYNSSYKAANPSAPPHVPKVLDVKPGQKAFIVGTLYVHMPLKPSILDSVTRESWILPPPPKEKYTSKDDAFLLEDESGRVRMLGPLFRSSSSSDEETDHKKALLVTGVVAGFVGEETITGEFIVSDIVYPSFASASAPERPLSSQTAAEEDGSWIAFVSGLNLGKDSGMDMGLQLLIDFLSGEVGSPEVLFPFKSSVKIVILIRRYKKDRKLAGSILRLVVAGNSVQRLMSTDKAVRNKFGHEVATFDGSPMRLLDTLLNQVCSNLDVDLMPGEADPTPTFLPQPPFHHGLFSKSGTWSTLNRVSNPHSFVLEKTPGISPAVIDCMGTSGQNLEDVYRFVDDESRLDMAEAMLRWAHLAPTAPDTLRMSFSLCFSPFLNLT